MSIEVMIRCREHNRRQKLPLDVLQFARDSDGKKVMRRLTVSKDVIKGPWQYDARPFKTGLYCQYCLNEGQRTPLSVDEEDLPDLDLADQPVVFLDPEMFRVDETVKALQESFPSIQQYIHELEAVPASYGDITILERLMPELRRAVQELILGPHGQLYAFQTEAINAALDGSDVVVTTPTASGKSLTYMLPIVDTLLRDPSATALYLSPLVALTEDQMESITRLDGSGTNWEVKGARFSHHRVCRKLELGKQSVTIARYEGSVSPGDRQYIRRTQPQYILTTPDMLHVALLNGAFDEKQWDYLFAGLRYVVIDELHTYKGIFGASFANLIRRLLRVCIAHGTSPAFLCASATIQEPIATVEKLIGRQPFVVDGGTTGAPQKRRKFVLWSNSIAQDTRALSTQAKDVLLFTLKNRIRSIAFARSISEINDIYRFVTAELRESDHEEIRITPFMRELRLDQKRQIIRDLKAGTVHGVISTNALSMGVDIGNLSAAVIIGFPGSIAALWQQAGRAGRAGEGLVVLIADTNPLDQFFVNHPAVLFDLNAEPIYCNPDNPYLVEGHLLCAARELPLENSEIEQFGPSAKNLVQTLLDNGMLIRESDTHRLLLSNAARSEFEGISLRNISFSIDVLSENNRDLVAQVDAARAQRVLHRYAHYQYLNQYFEVTRFDVDFQSRRGSILIKELEKPEYTTTAKVNRDVSVKKCIIQQPNATYIAHFGIVQSKTEVEGYYKVPLFVRNEPFKYQPLGIAAPPPLAYDTHALWLTFDERCLFHHSVEEKCAGLYSLAEAMRLATAIEELCDPSDLDAISFLCHPDTQQPTIMVYDTTPGGIGITESAHRKIYKVLLRALQILDECPYCSKYSESRGCPYCVTARYGDETTINRHIAIDIIQMLLSS
ncbi:MAG: DEAD/DEAH box helicase [Caldilineaceae bacterium]